MHPYELNQLLQRYPGELYFLRAALNLRLRPLGQSISLSHVAEVFWQEETQALLESGIRTRQLLQELAARYNLGHQQLLQLALQEYQIAGDLAEAALQFLREPTAPSEGSPRGGNEPQANNFDPSSIAKSELHDGGETRFEE
jgi:hypothetical protein